jgi:signal transduction histidine kinase/ligand-binding sensor domain-containing protein
MLWQIAWTGFASSLFAGRFCAPSVKGARLRNAVLAIGYLASIAFPAVPWSRNALAQNNSAGQMNPRRLASALSGQADNTQVMEQTWSIQQGAPEYILTLAQTADGFLWLGGQGGLFRFDGTRFERFHPPSGDQMLSTSVLTVYAPPTGGLWIGYLFGGFSFVNNGRVKSYAYSTGGVTSFAQDSEGTLWAGTSSGLWRFDGSTWRPFGEEWRSSLQEIGFDQSGTLWAIATDGHLLYLLPGSKEFRVAKEKLDTGCFTLDADQHVVTSPDLAPNFSGSRDVRLHAYPILRSHAAQFIDRAGNVWISDDRTSKLLMHLPASDRLEDAITKASISNSEAYDVTPFIFKGLIDREGNIWFCDKSGVHRFFYTTFTKERFPWPFPSAIAAGENGAIWMTGFWNSGFNKLYQVINEKIHILDFPGPTYWTVAYRAPDNTLWFGGTNGLCHLIHQVPLRFPLPSEMIGQGAYLQSLAEDRAGGLWVSFGRHGLYRLADGQWTSFGGRNDIPRTGVIVEFSDSQRRVWFGFTNNQVAVLDGDKVRVFGPSDGIRIGNVAAISGRGSDVWIGGEFGLQKFDEGRFRTIQAVDDDWLLGISGIVETAEGDLWLNGLTGIFHISRAEIGEALNGHSYRVRGEHIGNREGLPGFAPQLRPLPTAIEGTDGRVWFALSSGVVWLDPTRVKQKAFVAPVAIQSVLANGKNYEINSSRAFPAHTSSVTIRYSAISLSDPEAIRSRVKLRETDADWHEVNTGEPVTYRNLAPGQYHFSVSVSDTNGVWSDEVAHVDFTILPAWYQTNWFRVLCVCTVLLLLWILYRLRLKQLERQFNLAVQARVNERTRIARELHDTLLQSFQSVAFQLQAARKLLRRKADNAMEVLDEAIHTTEDSLQEGRTAIRDLRPGQAAQRDLPELLKAAGHELEMAHELDGHAPDYQVLVEGKQQDISPLVQDEIYRISREVIRNAFAHAAATHIEVELRYDHDQLRVRIRDDGKGIDADVLKAGGQPGHWGIPGMRERAHRIGSRLEFWSDEGAGTEVQFTVPASTAYQKRRDGHRFRFFRRATRHE